MKAALVDVGAGKPASDRRRIDTPRPARPDAVATVIRELVDHFSWSGAIGCTFPGVVRGGATVLTAANLHPSWEGVDAASLFGSTPESPITMINDADAAGLAEVHHGAARGVPGVVFMLTIGTGLGSALFTNGVLVPNTELGHLEVDGVDAETRASSRAREDEGLSLRAWARRLERYLQAAENLFWPDLFVIGGGVSKQFDDFAKHISIRTPMKPATLRNQAGIVGAAMAAANIRAC